MSFLALRYCGFYAFIVVFKNNNDGYVMEYNFFKMINKFEKVCDAFGVAGIYNRVSMEDSFSFYNHINPELDDFDNPPYIIMITPHDRKYFTSALLYQYLSDYKRNIMKSKGIIIKKYKLTPSAIHQIAEARVNKNYPQKESTCGGINTRSHLINHYLKEAYHKECVKIIGSDKKLQSAFDLWYADKLLNEALL